MGKNNEYLEISKQIVANIGGMDNIQGTAHCATRLRIVLKDNDLADIEKLEDIDKVKGAFIAGNQLQLILGAGTVNDVYEVFAEYTNKIGKATYSESLIYEAESTSGSDQSVI